MSLMDQLTSVATSEHSPFPDVNPIPTIIFSMLVTEYARRDQWLKLIRSSPSALRSLVISPFLSESQIALIYNPKSSLIVAYSPSNESHIYDFQGNDIVNEFQDDLPKGFTYVVSQRTPRQAIIDTLLFEESRIDVVEQESMAVYLQSINQIPVPSSKPLLVVTGACGFIGGNLCSRLLDLGFIVVGIDNMNNYYPVKRKILNLKRLNVQSQFYFHLCDIQNVPLLQCIFGLYPRISRVIHLAAQAGVRFSLDHPAIVDAINRVGTLNVMQMVEQFNVPFLIYASSSSVYGEGAPRPCKENLELGKALNPYAQSKRHNEFDAMAFTKRTGITTVGLRFFTVGGPMVGGGIGRPDMALASFISHLMEGESINLFGDGSYTRDFTDVEDVVDGIILTLKGCMDKRIKGSEVFNIAEGETTSVGRMIVAIASNLSILNCSSPETLTDRQVNEALRCLESKGLLCFHANNPADVTSTYADTTKARTILGFHPKHSIFESIRRCIKVLKPPSLIKKEIVQDENIPLQMVEELQA